MEEQKVSYETEHYNAIKASLFVFPIFVLLVALSVISGIYFHNPVVAVVGSIIGVLLPIIFKNQLKSPFVSKVILEFNNDFVSIMQYSCKAHVLKSELTIKWSDVVAYNVSFSPTYTTYLNIYMRSGEVNRLSFKEDKSEQRILIEKSAFSLFHYFIWQNNRDAEAGNTIEYRPALFATKKGATILWTLASLSAILIVVHLMVRPDTSMFSFMSLFIILGLLGKRKGDQTMMRKIDELVPHSPF